MVVQSLRDEGVEYLFGYPGGAVLDIYDAIHTLGGIEHILVRHEQAAAHNFGLAAAPSGVAAFTPYVLLAGFAVCLYIALPIKSEA